jgi:hypothetical protein
MPARPTYIWVNACGRGNHQFAELRPGGRNSHDKNRQGDNGGQGERKAVIALQFV